MNLMNENKRRNMNCFYSGITSNPKILFGGYPTKSSMTMLKNVGVKYIVDLTTINEKKRLDIYNPKEFGMVYIHFPIRDNFVPYCMDTFHDFISWVVMIIESLQENECIYIHCKGGHGRSGMIVGCILCLLYNKTPSESIREVTDGHQQRFNHNSKWKSRMCPSNEVQRTFIERICKYKEHHTKRDNPARNRTQHPMARHNVVTKLLVKNT